MSRRISFHLTATQLAELEEAMNHASQPEVRQRATAIRLLHFGHAPEAVAQMVAVAPSSIWNWHRRWRQNGVRGLANAAKSGRPAKANDRYLEILERVLNTDPSTLGYGFVLWTINRLRHYLAEQTGILLSYTRFRSLLSKHGYVYRQPKHELSALQDPQAQATARELLEWLKKTSPTPQTGPVSSSLWTKRP
jgi:transposase